MAIIGTDFWKLGGGNCPSPKPYSISRLILLCANKIEKFTKPENTANARNLGLLNGDYEKWIPLANNIVKYHDRFDNLPSDKLAKEWLDEVLEQ
jgi:hypothetical protein